jgi:hypothetical protein
VTSGSLPEGRRSFLLQHGYRWGLDDGGDVGYLDLGDAIVIVPGSPMGSPFGVLNTSWTRFRNVLFALGSGVSGGTESDRHRKESHDARCIRSRYTSHREFGADLGPKAFENQCDDGGAVDGGADVDEGAGLPGG